MHTIWCMEGGLTQRSSPCSEGASPAEGVLSDSSMWPGERSYPWSELYGTGNGGKMEFLFSVRYQPSACNLSAMNMALS